LGNSEKNSSASGTILVLHEIIKALLQN